MPFYRSYLFPLLRKVDAETAHDRTLQLLELAQRWPPGRLALRFLAGHIPQQPVELFGLTFANCLGVAAGFDKDVRVAHGLGLLGFGHVEVGTLTPREQAGNPRPRVFRLPEDQALINRMGFPNGGVNAALPRLQKLAQLKNRSVIGVSLGKQKETPLADALNDYLAVMQAVYPYADYLAVNISSPNTPGLRDLQGGRYLSHLLASLGSENRRLAAEHELQKRPLLLKIAPDLSQAELDEILDTATTNKIDGLIATNTTTDRQDLLSPRKRESGGLSGRPLRQRSQEIIAYIHDQLGDRLPVIGIGGIFDAKDVQTKLDAGAKLVQLYTGLIYIGPGIAGHILRDLKQA